MALAARIASPQGVAFHTSTDAIIFYISFIY